MLPVLRVRVFSVINVVRGDGNQVLANVLGDVRASPDKLSGFGTVLSAMSARITKIQPHQNRFILLLAVHDSIKNSGAPIETLKN